MKIKLIALVLFSFTHNYIHSQTLKGIITEKTIKGVGEKTALSEKSKKPVILAYTYSQNKSIQKLLSNQKSSIDTSYIENQGTKYHTVSTISKPSALIRYKDFKSKEFKIVFTQDDKDTNLIEPLPVLNWKIINENKTISGYSCKKATTTNTAFNTNQAIVAWYTDEVPINDGPMHYSGLPGFIMQIEISDLTVFTFSNLVFSKENTPIEAPNNSAPELSFSEYSKQIK